MNAACDQCDHDPKVAEKYGVADDGLFAEVEEYFKQSCAAQPQIEPFIQDALVEFRTEARRMVER